MSRLLLALLLLSAALCIPAASAPVNVPPATPDGDLYVLGISLDQHADLAHAGSLNNWDHYVDEVVNVFRDQGSRFYRKELVRRATGAEATSINVSAGLAWLRQNVRAQDRVFIYISSHAGTDAQQGWVITAADGKQVWGRDIKRELATLPCHVMVMISSCGSGGFASTHPQDVPLPANVTALCGCSYKETTYNQIDMAVAEALYGRADFNHDGVVTLNELIRYVGLRYHEWWPEPRTTAGSEIGVAKKAAAVRDDPPLTVVSPNLGAVAHDGTWYSALVRPKSGDVFPLHLLAWADQPGPDFIVNQASRSDLCLPADGPPLLVRNGARWVPAVMVKQDGKTDNVRLVPDGKTLAVPDKQVAYSFAGKPDHPVETYPSSVQPGSWARLGPEGSWKDTRTGAILGGRLYTVETNGCMYRTDLSDGTWKQIGGVNYANAGIMFATDKELFAIDDSGSLNRMDPKSGGWTVVGQPGVLRQIRRGAVIGGQLYSVDTDGALHRTDLSTGARSVVGKAEFGNTTMMVAARGSLFTIETDGTLYRVSPTDGSWTQVGKPADWKPTQAAVVLRDRLYTVETSGRLYRTDVSTGAWTPLGGADFGSTTFMFAAGHHLYTIERDGSLYQINVQ